MTTKQGLVFGLAVCAAWGASAETLSFTPKATANGQYTWASKENWLTSSGANKVPAEGDDLLIDTPANNFHAANVSTYVQSIRFTTNSLPYSGISWNGFYLKSGGAGLKVEHTSDKSAYSTLYLDGDVTIDLAGGMWWEGGVVGRTSTAKSRITKLGTANLNLKKVQGNWTGATIREGRLTLGTDSGQSGIDFVFDGSASSAYLVMGGNLTLKDGGLSSTADLPTTNHGVTDNSNGYLLTLSGTPKTTAQYYAGSFNGKMSFAFTPSVSGCTFTLARATSPTTGRLVISNGTFRVADGASFTSLAQLAVKKDGVFSLAADAGTVSAAAIDVTDGAIQVDAGVVWEQRAITRGGEAVADGDYTATNCTWVTGEGTVRINHRKDYVDPIYLNVDSGSTVTLSEALIAYNASHADESVTVETLNGGADAARSLVKTGLGVLRMETPIANFTGSVHIEEGVLKTEVRYSLGKESNADAPVFVYSGATYSSLTTNTALNVGRTVHISGTGAKGYSGALNCIADRVAGNYHLYHVFGTKLILEGDASVKVGSWIDIAPSLTLNGHTLTAIGDNTNYNDTPIHIANVIDDGRIVISNAEWRTEGNVAFSSTKPDNVVDFVSRGGFRFVSNRNGPAYGGTVDNWLLRFTGPNSALYTDYHISSRDSGVNRLTAPLELDTVVALMYQGDRRRGCAYLYSPISGPGGFKTDAGRNVFLHLFNPNNSFTGGLRIDHGVFWAYPNGSFPSEGTVTLASASATYNVTGNSDGNKNFQNFFDGVAFMQRDTYVLPELVSEGTFPMRVQNGQGRWKKVTQKGTSVLEYYSELGAPRLEVTQGTVKLPRGIASGLWEGTNIFADATKSQAAYDGTATYTNLAVRGPTSALQVEAYNYTTWQAKECITYSGYIWNRGAEDVTWTLASSLGGAPVTVKIDGTAVLTAASSTLAAANVTLTPGPHAFEYRAYSGNSAPWVYEPTGWPKNFGFVYDVQGRNDTSVTNNFVPCVDTGDGALFTRTTDAAGRLPVFDEMVFASGASFDVNGNAYTAATVKGWPTVSSSATDASANPSFAITNKFVVDGADLAADHQMTVQMPLDFGETGLVVATNLATAVHGKYTIATTTADTPISFAGTASLRTRLTTDDTKWRCFLADDGKSIRLEYHDGFAIILR